MTQPYTRAELMEKLHRRLAPRYIDQHPLMKLLYAGKLDRVQMRAWIVNRFYLQNNIAIKDAAIVSNCPVPEVRRLWMARAIRREGLEAPMGDVDGWLVLAEAAGLSRKEVTEAGYLPGARFAVNDLVNYARRSSWLEGVSTSLYETQARTELVKRIGALKTRYRWIKPEGLRFFLSRLSQLDRDSRLVLDIVMRYCDTRELQETALAAAAYLGEVVWSLHDAVYMDYVIEGRQRGGQVSRTFRPE
jgi:pyrroloquinoline-quinone synthase